MTVSKTLNFSELVEKSELAWRFIFWLTLIFYLLFYAPYGINETDGGFLTGLAWQLACGKKLYTEVIYVRPPLPVWLRFVELKLLPEGFQVLGERWIFYLKMAACAWLAADLIASKSTRWMLASFAFVVSVHCYPPAAWHTVDGIFFSVVGLWFCLREGSRGWQKIVGGAFIFGALLCKQSFYPMAAVVLAVGWAGRSFRPILGFLAAASIFLFWIKFSGIWEPFWRSVAGSAEAGKAVQSGFFDYFSIHPALLAASVFCLAPVFAVVFFEKKSAAWATAARLGFAVFLLVLPGSFIFQVLKNQDFTAPFSQSRVMFGVAVFYLIFEIFKLKKLELRTLKLACLLAVAWCASISWGYSLPVLFSGPMVFVFFQLGERLRFRKLEKFPKPELLALFFILLLTFRIGYEFIYRDGKRSEMRTDLGIIFPKLRGIRSDETTARKYADLKNLKTSFASETVVLPSLTQADFLLGTRPALPLDWVVQRETNGDNALIFKILKEKKPIVFVEKNYGPALLDNPEFAVTAHVLKHGKRLGETEFFEIYQFENER